MKRQAAGIFGIGACVVLASAPATAQDGGQPSAQAAQDGAPNGNAGGRARYENSYFTPFAPSNALDIVRRVPGFSIDGGNSGVRGFGGAAGNVVVNGARPTSKSDGIGTILSRIPAGRVVRVEVGSGELFGSEFAGRAQVLNVILDSAGGLAGTLTAALRRDSEGRVTPTGDASALFRRGRSTFSLSGAFDRGRFPERGTDEITRIEPGVRIGDGRRLELREKFNDGRDQGGRVAGSWEHAGGDNRTAHANFRAQARTYRLDQDSRVTFAAGLIRDTGLVRDAGLIRDDSLAQVNRDRNYEIGGDVTRPLWGGGVKLIGLATRFSSKGQDLSLEQVEDEVIGGARQSYDVAREETVLRLLWSRGDWGGWSVEAGAEGALNRLDSDVDLSRIARGGTETPIDLPVDEAVVTEYRGEAFVNAGRKLSPTIHLDLGLTYEASRLTVTGDTRAARSLLFPKPSLTLGWRSRKGWQAQLSVRRTVAQLNFDDFVSSAELSNDRIDAGNAELLPQRAWEALATVDRPILGDGSAKVEIGYERISLLQDRVPTPEGFDAPGNLGTGRKAFVSTTINAPLTRFGIKGGRLSFNVLGQHTAVRDPYTGRDRRFSGEIVWDFDADYRQDLGRYAYGFGYYGQPRRIYYRRDETDESNSDERFVNAFAEYRATSSSTLTLSVDNVLDNPSRRFRTFYEPDRTNPAPSVYEERLRLHGRTVTLRYKRNFG